MTLKIRSRSIRSNQLFPSSPQCIYASLVKIYTQVKKITHRYHIFNLSKCPWGLENKVKVTIIHSTLCLLKTMYLCKFGQNLSTGSKDYALKRKRTSTLTPTGSTPKTIYPPPSGLVGHNDGRVNLTKEKLCDYDKKNKKNTTSNPGADPGFLENVFIYMYNDVWRVVLLFYLIFLKYPMKMK